MNDKYKYPELIRPQYENEKLKALIGGKEFGLKINELFKNAIKKSDKIELAYSKKDK